MNTINNLFPLLSVNHSLTDRRIENHSLESSQKEQNQNNISSDQLHPFFPSFSHPDMIFKIIKELGFCNDNGVFNGSCSRLFIFEILKNSPSFLSLQSRINGLLDKKFKILTGPITYLKKEYPLDIQISLREILKCIEGMFPFVSNFPAKVNNNAYLVEAYLIGSELLRLIGKDCFIEMCYRLFSEKIEKKTLETWFSTMAHFSEQIDKEGADLDLRIVLSCNDIDSYAFVTQSILEWLTIKIHKYIYQNYSNEPIFNPYFDFFNYCKSFLLDSNGIRHFNRVDNELTKCTILSLNTDYKSIDINVVGLDNRQLTLENPNLSSLNCYALPLLRFLNKSSLEKIFIDSYPFYGQALIDLLLNSMTPTTYNQDGWKHALRKGGRFLNPSYEQKMVDDLVEKKDQILSKIDLKRMILPEEKRKTFEGYIYLVIHPYFKKIENEVPNIRQEPYYLAEFIFRVCQSLGNHSSFTNEFFYQLWKLVDTYHWGPQIKEQCSSSSIYTEMKIALVEDRIPWNVFVAYLEILIWLWDSDSATIHNGKPYFHLKKPFHMRVKIQLNENLEEIESYFSINEVPDSLKKIGEIFSSEKIKVQSMHPLKDYLPALGINSFTFTKNIEKLLKSPAKTIKTMGLQLYLSLFESFPSDQLYLRIYQNQTQLIGGVFNQHQEKIIYEKLKNFQEVTKPFKLIVKAMKKLSMEQLNKEKLELLPLLVSHALSNNEYIHDAMSVIIGFIQEVISFTPGLARADHWNDLEWFDEFLVTQEFQDFVQKVYESSVENNVKLKNFFLEYLRKSYSTRTENRERTLWEIFQQTLRLFPKIRNAETKALNLNISVSLAILIKETSFIPDRILKWLLEFQTTILERLYKDNRIDHLKTLLKVLQGRNLHEKYSREVFKLDWDSLTVNQDILSSLNKNDLEFLKAYIKPDQYSKLIDLLIFLEGNKIENELIEDLIQWLCQINKDHAIFHLSDETQLIQHLDNPLPFDQAKFNDLLLLHCESLWKQSKLIKFVFAFQYLSYQDLSYQEKLNTLSYESWKILWSFLSEHQKIKSVEGKKLIVRYWNIYKISKYGAFENANKEIFSIAVSCLRECPSELMSLLANDDWLKMWNSCGDSFEITSLLRTMFTGVIKNLSLHPFDEQFFTKINELKKHYFKKIQSINQKNSLKIADQWEQKINDELIKHLSQDYSSNAIKALCLVFNNKIQSSQYKALNKNELNIFLSLCTNLSSFENEIQNSDFEFIYSIISAICQKIRFQNDIETQFFIKLMECLKDQTSPLKWLQIIKFFPVISTRNDQKNLKQLVPMYLKGITYLLNYFSGNLLNHFNKDFLEELFLQAKSFHQISLKLKISQKQTPFISYLFFKYLMIEKNIKKIQCSDQTILNDAKTFKEFFPKFFTTDKFLIDSLEWMGISLVQYSELFSHNGIHIINKVLFDVLFIKTTLKFHDQSLRKYYQQALEIIFNKKIDPRLFVEALYFVGNEYIRLFKEKKLEFKEVVELINEIVFFFPPSWENDCEILNCPSSTYLQTHKMNALEFLKKLKEIHRFSTFLPLDVYLHPELLYDLQINKNEKNELYKLLDRLLTYTPPDENSLMIAGVILPKILLVIESDEINKLKTRYINFFELTKNVNSLKKPHEIVDVINYNIKKTENNLINYFSKERKFAHEFLSFLYPNAYAALVNLISNFKGCHKQFDLLFTSIELIESQFEKSQYDFTSTEEYLDKLHHLKPVFLQMMNELMVNDSNATNLAKAITSLLDALSSVKVAQKLLCNVNAQTSDLLKQRKSFFEFLDELYTQWILQIPQESKYFTFLIFIPYLKVMIEIENENVNFSFLNKHETQIKEKFEEAIGTHGTRFEKEVIKIINFLNDDSLNEIETNNILFTSIINSIFDIRNKDQLLTILKITSVLFFENIVKNKIKKNVFNTLFKYHLKLLENYFKQHADLLEKNVDFLITYTATAMKKKLFESQEEGEYFFCWVSQYYYLFNRKDPLFDLFSLRFVSSKDSFGEEEFEREALKLMPDLCHYIIQTGNFFYSYNLIDLIVENITDDNKKIAIFVDWLRTFEQFPIKKEDKLLCENHVNEILQKCKKISSVSFPSVTLTFNYVKNEEFPSKDYLSLDTITVKKCIAEYFNLESF